jgi:hypothetical protein
MDHGSEECLPRLSHGVRWCEVAQIDC